MDALLEPGVYQVVIMSSAQVGKTTILKAIIGYHIDQDPAPILCVNPTEAMAEAFSKDRLSPMIRDMPALAARVADPKTRDTGNTILHKRFPGGHITMIGANAPASLASRPIRILLCDEVDRYPASAGTEGDPVNLAIRRTATFHNRRLLMTSTPTIKGCSRIEMEFLKSDQRRYVVPCPHCRQFHPLEWANVRWPENEPEQATMSCPHCLGVIEERHKFSMLERGQWRAESPCKGIAGFHINELYSPWRRWSEVAIDFLAAKKSPETLKTWINTSLGQSWEEAGEKYDPDALLSRRENYSAVALPARILYLTGGVDVQDDRLEAEVIGWRKEGDDSPPESWGVEYFVLNGDPGRLDVWSQLDAVLQKAWGTEDGRLLRISAACIDSGGHHTAQVYAFCEARRGRRVHAVKGMPGTRPIWNPKAGKSQKYNAQVWHVGTDSAKEAWYARLRISDMRPGYCHFPANYPESFFLQLTAEQVRTRYSRGHPVREWVLPSGKRNEALDVRVYGLAALLAYPVPWELLASRSGSPFSVQRAPVAPRRNAPPRNNNEWGL